MSVQEQKADAVMIVLLEGEHQALCESCSAACHCLDLLSEYRHWRNCVCNTMPCICCSDNTFMLLRMSLAGGMMHRPGITQ